MVVDGALLHRALAAFFAAGPDFARLEASLREQRWAPLVRERVAGAIAALLDELTRALVRARGPLDERRERALAMTLRARHPWLDAASLQRLTGFVRWLEWHG